MSPSTSWRSVVTSSTTSPFSTVTLLHTGSVSVADTTYLGRLFNLSAQSPLRDPHHDPKYASAPLPSNSARVVSASANSTLSHASASVPRNWSNQPPCRKPSSPVGSSTTPS